MKVRIASKHVPMKPDFTSLKDTLTAEIFDRKIETALSNRHVDPECAKERLQHLNNATQEAIKALPVKKAQSFRKRFVSSHTKKLVETRARFYDKMSTTERRVASRGISRSCRNDYRSYINEVVGDIAAADRVGNTREISRLTRSISSRPKPSNKMPTKTSDGTPITSSKELLDAWHKFLGKKFACNDCPGAAYNPGINDHLPGEDEVTWEEFCECCKALRTNRAPGPDGAPIEVYLASPSAMQELYEIVCLLVKHESIPNELVHALFIMLYKKGSRDDFANYRAIGLLCHSYKVFSVLILRRIQPALEARLPDSQAGFRKARGCRDNVFILKQLISELVRANEEAMLGFIDYTAAFDSLSHRFLDESLAEAMVPPKTRRLIAAIYANATGSVRIQQSGEQTCSESFPIRRGAIQGDIFSPQSFTIALDRIFCRHDIECEGVGGPPLRCPKISKLEYADDGMTVNKTASEASARLSALAQGGSSEAGLDISLKKTKGMPIRRYPAVSDTTEEDVVALNLPHKCPACGKGFTKLNGLNKHRARWCDPNKTRSRKGTLADKAVKRAKQAKQATELPHIFIHDHELENVVTFDYLGCRSCGDGNDTEDLQHRMCVAQARFSELFNIWRDARLPQSMKLTLYRSSVCSTFNHGCEAWTLTPPNLRSLNGFNSRCLHHITGRSYRMEAVSPTFDLVAAVRSRRLRWLGHILRMPVDRLLHQTVCELAAGGPPYPAGSILMDCHITFEELLVQAGNREF